MVVVRAPASGSYLKAGVGTVLGKVGATRAALVRRDAEHRVGRQAAVHRGVEGDRGGPGVRACGGPVGAVMLVRVPQQRVHEPCLARARGTHDEHLRRDAWIGFVAAVEVACHEHERYSLIRRQGEELDGVVNGRRLSQTQVCRHLRCDECAVGLLAVVHEYRH
ncbi:hypothetical protein Vretifemale_19104 [Volvox reticuliferus]|uniref:Uncharacterized protein n=1 Tax=Volvox reticuliferus TaxID=1737510 RepID=A0A8J4D2A9_9CHLO|nr:hypothetical protein Vretifemale_19104 [Volvox reticuliferus]